MENIFDKAGDLVANLKEYANNRVSMVKLEAAERSSKVIAAVIAASVIAVFILLFLMFLGMCAATLLSEWTGAPYAGSLIVAGVYLFSAILLWWGRERIIRIPVMNAILHKIFSDEEDKED